jgi:hypothetical protein
MPNVYNNKQRRAYHKTPLTLLTTAALVFLAAAPVSAQSAAQNPRLYNPNTPWDVTDKATALNPSCLLQRSYNPNITVKISSDITGKAHVNVSNIPQIDAQLTGVSFDGTAIAKFSANGATQLNATLANARTDLAPLYSGEYIVLSYDNAPDLKLPIQSTTIAEARMSLCVDVINGLKSINTEAAVSIDLDEMRAAAQDFEANRPIEIADDEPLPINTLSASSEDDITASSAIDAAQSLAAPIDDALSRLIDEVSTEQDQLAAIEPPAPIDKAATEKAIEDIAAEEPASPQDIAAADTEQQAAPENVDPMLDIDSLIDESLDVEALPDEAQMEVAAAVDPVNALQEGLPEIAIIEDTPVMADQEDAPLNIEDDVSSALETSLNQATDNAIEDFAAQSSPITVEELASDGEIMDDDDILSALTQNANDSAAPQLAAQQDIDTATDVPLDALITMDDTPVDVSEADIEKSLASDIDQAILETLSSESVSGDDDENTADALTQAVSGNALFDDTLSIEIEDDSGVSDSDDENIVDDLANEDFSDQELLALLDDPSALSDDFAEIMVEEEFKQIKPMEGVRQMLGLGTPDDIEYKKVPWLLEEDIDSQWKEKVKLLEREKEMLRLRLADTNANPIADLISRKRNRRTQEELVEKIKALEAENNKLKKGLLLSDNPEEFLGEDLKISDPKSGMRMGMAQTSKIDLINEDIDNDLDSLETRMDSFLKGVGEDYALANSDQTSPLASASLTQDIINILKAGYVVDPDALKIRAYRHKSTGTAVTAWEAGDLQGRAERSVLPPNADFTAYVERFLNAAQLRCTGNFTAVPDTSTRNLKTLDIHCNDGAVGQRSSVIFIKHGSIITAIATTTNLPKGGSDFLRDIRKRIIEGIRVMDRKKT